MASPEGKWAASERRLSWHHGPVGPVGLTLAAGQGVAVRGVRRHERRRRGREAGRRGRAGGLLACAALADGPSAKGPADGERHLQYVAAPGIRNDLQYGGAGILAFDIDRGRAFLKHIEAPLPRRTV
jgi:hypothetical protein